MGNYLFMLIAVSLVIGFASFLFLGEERASRFAVGVLFMYATVLPAVAAIKKVDIGSVFGNIEGEFSDGEYELVAKDAFEEGIRDAVCQKFSLAEDNVRISAHGFDFEKMSADSISVVLSGTAIFSDIEKIEKYVTALGCGRCEVEIEL